GRAGEGDRGALAGREHDRAAAARRDAVPAHGDHGGPAGGEGAAPERAETAGRARHGPGDRSAHPASDAPPGDPPPARRPHEDASPGAPPSEERPGVRREAGERGRRATLAALLPVLTALPAAVLVMPDAVINVVPAAASALELGDAGIPDLLRATGLSLPALVATVPLAAVAARRLPAWTVLLAGAAVLLAGVAGARLAGSVPLVAAVRATQGVGA